MLKKILKSAVFCAPLAMIACGDNSSPAAVSPQKDIVVQKDSLVVDTIITGGDTIIKVDTIQTVDTVKVPSVEKAPYYVENTDFNWDNLQDASTQILDVNGVVVPQKPSQSEEPAAKPETDKPSSGENLVVVPTEDPSTVENGVLTDGRDGQTYKVENVGGALWMAENINYKPATGTLCEKEGKDYCSTFGMFYSKTAMKSACPKGWHLPSEAEVNAADAVVEHEWWTIAGRFKSDGSYGNEKQGYIWLANGSTFLVENYSENDRDHKIVSDTEGRYYNVRCVQD